MLPMLFSRFVQPLENVENGIALGRRELDNLTKHHLHGPGRSDEEVFELHPEAALHVGVGRREIWSDLVRGLDAQCGDRMALRAALFEKQGRPGISGALDLTRRKPRRK